MENLDTPGPTRRSVTVRLPGVVLAAAKLLLAALIIAGLYLGKDILVPLALAGLLAFLLDPLVMRLRRWQVPRALAVALVMLATLATVAGASVLVALQAQQLGQDLPRYQSTIENKLRSLRRTIMVERSSNSATRLIDVVGHEVEATRKALEQAASGGERPPMRVKVAAAETPPLQALGAWLSPAIQPLLTGGIALVLLIFILLDRHELRDRLLRLAGVDLHPMTDALDEAANRVSRYLGMQLLVNVGYGLPLALGLWLIGVPGALLWGVLAGVMRFVPYVGPLVAAVFPLAMAFAVDPGWHMLIWTVVLLLALELIINNLIEPWLYGASTGLAAVAVLVSAAFWTVLWGPVGLLLATPMTVCLVVLGRHLPALRFLDLLLGKDPVFDAPTRLYQRLLAGHVEAATELAECQIASEGLAAFYSGCALPALGMSAADRNRVASDEHRQRISSGMAALLHELRSVHTPETPAAPDGPRVCCAGLRWEADALAADMLTHTLTQLGLDARSLPATAISAENLGGLDLAGVKILCLSSFNPEPEAALRLVGRRLQRRWPGLQLVLALWHAPSRLREPGAAQALGARALVCTLVDATQDIQALLAEPETEMRQRPTTGADLVRWDAPAPLPTVKPSDEQAPLGTEDGSSTQGLARQSP